MKFYTACRPISLTWASFARSQIFGIVRLLNDRIGWQHPSRSIGKKWFEERFTR